MLNVFYEQLIVYRYIIIDFNITISCPLGHRQLNNTLTFNTYILTITKTTTVDIVCFLILHMGFLVISGNREHVNKQVVQFLHLLYTQVLRKYKTLRFVPSVPTSTFSSNDQLWKATIKLLSSTKKSSISVFLSKSFTICLLELNFNVIL